MRDDLKKQDLQGCNGLLSADEAAARLGIKAQTLANWRCTRKPDGPAYHKIGRRVLYHPDDIKAFQDSHRIDPNETHK